MPHRWQVYKANKNDANLRLGTGCPIMNGPNQDCMAAVLCNQYTKLTEYSCDDKWSTNTTLRNLARNQSVCWRCGDGLVDPDEVCDEYSGAR